jgi:hypothetical protein
MRKFIRERAFDADQLALVQRIVTGVVQAIIRRILQQASEEVRPCDVVNNILLGLQTPGNDLGVKMIWERVKQRAFHGERLVQELLVKGFFGLMNHNAERVPLKNLYQTSCNVLKKRQ